MMKITYTNGKTLFPMLSAALVMMLGGMNSFEEEIPIYRKSLSIDDLSRILSSELKNEFTSIGKDNVNHNELLKKATDLEWSRAKKAQTHMNEMVEKEETSAKHLRRPVDRDLNQDRNAHDENGDTNVFVSSSADSSPLLYPYVACVQKHGRSGHICSDIVKQVFGENVMPLYNYEDMACYITSALAEVAENATFPIVVQPLLPEMKIGEDTVRSIEKDYPPPSRFNAFLCPEYSGNTTEAIKISKQFITNIAQGAVNEGDQEPRSLLSETFLRSEHPEMTKAQHRHLMWSEAFEEGIDSIHHCEDMFSNITSSASNKAKFVTFTMPDLDYTGSDTRDPFSKERACMFALLAGLVVRPEICSVEKMDNVGLLNGEAQWIVQSGETNKRPFFDAGLSGEGQVVACSDSGLDSDNCYFWDQTGEVAKNGGVDLTRRKVVQYVPYADGRAEFSSHGTHVSGTIVGRRAIDGRTETNGIADGVAPEAKIAFFDIGDANTRFLSTPNDSEDIFAPGLSAGAKVHSASWGTNFNGYGVQEREFDEFAYENDDFLIVIAAGNSGGGQYRTDIPNTVGSPATAKNIIAVGASQSAGDGLQSGMKGKDYLANFSSRGPTRDGRRKPEIVAPGYSILSANANPNREGECDNTGGVTYQAGTSMAAPVVSGTAALIRQYFEEGWYPLGKPLESNKISPSASLVKAILLNGAQSLVGVDNGRRVTQVRPYDNNQGFGRISMIDSLPLDGENDFRMKIIDRKSINDGSTDNYDITINTNGGCDVRDVSVTLVWTDPPSLPNCQQCVLNDLDLYMTRVGSSPRIYPNGLSRRDNTNNSERIRIGVSNGDRFIVSVKATDLDTVRQNYALVMTGCYSDDITPSPPTANPTKPPTPAPTQGPTDPPADIDVDATPSPTGRSPTRSPTNSLNSLFTTFDGGFIQAGNMFNVRAEKDIMIRSIDIHTASTGNVEVEVWTRSGSYRSQESSSRGWFLIVDTVVQGRGQGYATPIPEEAFASAIDMTQGEIRGWYVTLKSPDMIYSIGSLDGAIFVDNEDLTFGEGSAKTYPFGTTYKPRVWNGSFNYEVV